MNAKSLFRYDFQHRNQIAGIVRGTGATTSIADHIRAYERLEGMCDDAITRQETLSRSVLGRLALAPALSDQGSDLACALSAEGSRLTTRPFEEFRGAVDLAQKCIRNALPMATRRFIENLDRSEVVAIETLESEVARLRAEMRRQEEHILQCLPQCLEDVSAKLKFVVSLMLDGQEIETEYFAYLVEECADVMDGSIGHLRNAAAIAPQQQPW